MPRLRSPARVRAYDRRSAAIHEAGHFVIAERLGLRRIEARIFDHVGPPCLEVKSWGGTFTFSKKLRRSPERDRKMIAVAGAVADLCWARDPVDIDFFEMEETSMSARDWELAGCVPNEMDAATVDAIEHVAVLLEARHGVLWPRLCVVARALIEAHHVECFEVTISGWTTEDGVRYVGRGLDGGFPKVYSRCST